MEGQLSPGNVYNILIVFQHSLVLFVCANVFFNFTFCNFFYSADALLSMEMCQPESKKKNGCCAPTARRNAPRF